ncbi:MAG: helix-turn-helix domain-containing protein [Pseudomonadota bacterium]
MDRFGLDMASLSCRIDRIDRNLQGIRRDDAEHFFLLCQTEGVTGISHNQNEELLEPGDLMLLDSTKPAEMIFDGKTSAMVSLHMPRSLCVEAGRGALYAGKRVARRHPFHTSLQNLLLNDDTMEHIAFHSGDLFEFVSMVFGPDPEAASVGQMSNSRARYRFILETIDRHLTSPDLSLDMVAINVGMSRRQLQRELQSEGTSFTHLVQTRRVRHLVAHKRRADRLGNKVSLASLAYSAGFTDQAHFNRVFRRIKKCTPTEFFERQMAG